MAANALVDTRLLQKPPKYDNKRSEWALFKFVLRAYVGAISEEMLELMTAAEQETAIIRLDGLRDNARAHSRTLMYVLVSCLQGSALQLAMNTEQNNGLEAWRCLVKREEPTEGSTQVASLMGILRTQFAGGMAELTQELEVLTGAVQRYEQQFSDTIADNVVQAIIKSNTPLELRSQVMLQSFASAAALRETLVTYAAARVDVPPVPAPVPMDVGAVEGGKYKKGKDKKGKKGEKGKSKKGDGKGKNNQGENEEKKKFNGYCNQCGKWGHRKQDCWYKKGPPTAGAVDQQQQPQQQAQQQQQQQQRGQGAATAGAILAEDAEEKTWIF